MTSPVQATTTSSGRYYEQDGRKYVSVTTVLNALPKDALIQWAANMAADKAIELYGAAPERWEAKEAKLRDEIRYAHRQKKESAADLGTATHELAERNLRGEVIDLKSLDKELAKRYKHFLTFRQLYDIQPLHVEATVYNDTYGYAGSCDLMALVNGVPTIVDLKTSKGVYGTVALQLSAYKHAEYIRGNDGTKQPLPKMDKGAVLHLRPDGITFREVDVTEDRFADFLAVLRVKREWLDGAEKRALLDVIQPTPEAMWKLRMGTNA